MKKLFSIIVILLLFLSCNKLAPINHKEVNEQLINEIFSMPNKQDQKVSYNTLNEYEKLILWKKHFESFKASFSLSSEQKIFLNNSISLLTPKIFLKNSNEEIDFKNRLEFRLRTDFKNNFGDAIAKSLLTSLVDYTQPKASLTDNNPTINLATQPNCDCSKTSDWCSCPSSLAPYHCPWCQAEGCTASTWGCGTLFAYACDGMCDSAGFKE